MNGGEGFISAERISFHFLILLFCHRQMKLEEDKRRMAREQTVLGKFMYKCSTLISPRTKSDFEMLLANVQKWKETEVGSGAFLLRKTVQNLFLFLRSQTIRIHKLYQCDDTSKSVAYKQLLEHEIKLINEIRAKRQKILNDQQNKKVIKILDRLGAPVKWVGYKSKNRYHFFQYDALKITKMSSSICISNRYRMRNGFIADTKNTSIDSAVSTAEDSDGKTQSN